MSPAASELLPQELRPALVTFDTLAPGDPGSPTESTQGVTLAPGGYLLWCSLAGHEQAGMRGTLEVR